MFPCHTARLTGLGAVAALALSAPAIAGDLAIAHPWSRPTPPSAPTAVGYLTITNSGKTPDRLIGGSSPAAAKLEIHSMSMAGGIMRMRPVAGGVPIPAGGSVTLGPNGDHLMLIGLKRAFVLGDHIPITLRFEHAGEVKVVLNVEQPPAGDNAMPGMAMPDGKMGGR